MSEERFWEIVKEIGEITKQIQVLEDKKEILLLEKNDLAEALFGVRDGSVITVESLVRFIKNIVKH